MKQTKLMALMAVHFAAFQASALAAPALYEKREEPSIKSIADAIDKINTAFTEYRSTNDQRIEAIKKGAGTGDLDAKLAKMDAEMTSLSGLKADLEKLQTKLSRPGQGGSGKGEKGATPEAEAYKGAFISWVRNPTDPELRAQVQQRAKDLRKVEAKAFGDDDGFETRAAATVTSTGSAGGFALPEQIEQQIARLSVDMSPIRQIATVRTVGTPDYKELVDVNGAAFEWLGESGNRNQTNTPDLAEVAPTFGLGSAKPQASEESLDDLFFDVENWLVMSASEAIAQGEGASFVLGTGVNRPTGFLAGPAPVATADGTRAFGTLQYIASGQAAAMPTSLDTMYDIIYSLRARYRSNARWVTSKLLLSALRKYKDTTGQYLWQPAVAAGQPDAFMSYPVTEAEDMPVVAANAFPLAFGDFREGYLIADRVGMRVTRDEITTPGFVKFYVRKRMGGRLRNTQAIKLLKIATA
jgi:HK97 family phage major capsid protein